MAKKPSKKVKTSKAVKQIRGGETIIASLPDSARHIEEMKDDAFARAISRPVRAAEEPEPPEVEIKEQPKKKKKPKEKKVKQPAFTALEELFQFDREAFLKVYAKDLDKAKQLITRLMSLDVAYISAISSLQNDLDLEPDLRMIRAKNIQGQITPALQFMNWKYICDDMGIDLTAFLDWHLRNQEVQREANRPRMRSTQVSAQ